ncbi:hypothetical protein WSM22_03280 [Cytophagales bacterium WSM2-2]|nr:hypothetical protein WSM22_03280 [Cytophagales bacterium WSM2-2]
MITLITVDDIRENTSISNNIEVDTLQPYISSAEQMHVYKILGVALLTEIKNQISGNTLTDLNMTLLNDYIKPLACYATWLEASSFLNYKTTAKGVVKQHSDNSESTTLDEFTFYRSAIKDKVSFCSDSLKNYLKLNAASYPLYRPIDKQITSYSNGIYLGRH